MTGLSVGFIIADANGTGVFQFGIPLEQDGTPTSLAAGTRVTVRTEVENLLTPSRYFVHCGVSRTESHSVALYVHNAVDFVVYGGPDTAAGSSPSRTRSRRRSKARRSDGADGRPHRCATSAALPRSAAAPAASSTCSG